MEEQELVGIGIQISKTRVSCGFLSTLTLPTHEIRVLDIWDVSFVNNLKILLIAEWYYYEKKKKKILILLVELLIIGAKSKSLII